jgi:2-iminobutanoate/2-iminopropanoate deaminase
MSTKTVIATESAPKAIGPYSQAISVNGMVYCSGQIPLDPATGALVEGGIEAQTHQVLKNLGAVLKATGSDLKNVVKTTVFLQSMNDFAAMNAIYATYFTENPPARATVEVAKLPKGAIVEIEAIAFVA